VRRIKIFDTTLRDGEQSPGIALRPDEKVEIALVLERLGVDVEEAGYAAASPGDVQGVADVAVAMTAVTVASLARSTEGDIDAAVRALERAPRSRVHIFLATRDLHMKRKLGLTREQVLERIEWSVRYAAHSVDEVEFSAEDASRSDRAFLADACRTAVDSGASVVNLPDTVGYASPAEYSDMFRDMLERVPAAGDALAGERQVDVLQRDRVQLRHAVEGTRRGGHQLRTHSVACEAGDCFRAAHARTSWKTS
jgi:2-isopropylmalate synthase